MLPSILICCYFAFLYALKGGSGPYVFHWWERVRAKNVVTERLLDGKVISTLGAFLFALWVNSHLLTNNGMRGFAEYSVDFVPALMFAFGWLLSVAPSMGEEHDAIGRTGHAQGKYLKWMPSITAIKIPYVLRFLATNECESHGGEMVTYYLQYPSGRMYGIKKGLQRGVWMGAIMALITGFIPFIAYSFLFVPCVFIGQEIYYRITGHDSWVLSEPLIGFCVFGIPISMWI